MSTCGNLSVEGDPAMTWLSLNCLTVAGLIYDIGGAALLARALFFSSIGELRTQATVRITGMPGLQRALCEQRVDARFGLVLLIVGFLLQLVGSLISTSAAAVLTVLLLIFAVVVVGYWGLRTKLVERDYRALRAPEASQQSARASR
jgi:hypothetical protein